MDPQKTHRCPICQTEIPPVPRYPAYVCEHCATRATSPDGRPLAFGNESLWGGYLARFADTGEPYDSHECYIDGIPCRADEARFGGIVIQVVERQEP